MRVARILITGCRHWYDPDMAESVVARLIARYGASIVVVHGACDGIDASFAEACRELDVKQEPHPARWDAIDEPGAIVRRRRDGTPYAANAGPIRNTAMLAASADLVIAFHRNLAGSKGTLDMVRQALAAGVPTYLCEDESATPVRLKEPV